MKFCSWVDTYTRYWYKIIRVKPLYIFNFEGRWKKKDLVDNNVFYIVNKAVRELLCSKWWCKMGVINDPNLKIWSETKEKLSYFGNLGQTGGSLWQSCLTTLPTEPSSLVRELGIWFIVQNIFFHQLWVCNRICSTPKFDHIWLVFCRFCKPLKRVLVSGVTPNKSIENASTTRSVKTKTPNYKWWGQMKISKNLGVMYRQNFPNYLLICSDHSRHAHKKSNFV